MDVNETEKAIDPLAFLRMDDEQIAQSSGRALDVMATAAWGKAVYWSDDFNDWCYKERDNEGVLRLNFAPRFQSENSFALELLRRHALQRFGDNELCYHWRPGDGEEGDPVLVRAAYTFYTRDACRHVGATPAEAFLRCYLQAARTQRQGR